MMKEIIIKLLKQTGCSAGVEKTSIISFFP